MAKKDKAELWWAYAISRERVAKQLVDRGLVTQEDINETIDCVYANIHSEESLYEFSVSPVCSEIMYTYLNKGFPQEDYLSLTDIARKINEKPPSYVIQSWLRSRNTLAFLRIWEIKNNPNFDESECDALLEAMKAPSFTVTPKQWITKTKAIGLVSKQGKNGGTLAHPDIAGDFHMWLYPEFRLTLIKYFRESGTNTENLD